MIQSEFTKQVKAKFGRKLTYAQISEIEQIAADIYEHPTVLGWCCACEADIAFAEHSLRETKPEIFK